MAVTVVAVSIFSQILAGMSRMRSIMREETLAANRGRAVLEYIRNQPLHLVFDLYNDSMEDDPAGAGTAPGKHFGVDGLIPLESDQDGFVGEIIFPAEFVNLASADLQDVSKLTEAEVERALGVDKSGESERISEIPEEFAMEGIWMLREDVVLPALGMPRDLNGDNRIDDVDHRYDAIVIPVLVRIRWQGRYGERSYECGTLLTRFDLGEEM